MKKTLIAVALLVFISPVDAVAVRSLGGGEDLLTLFFGGTIDEELPQVKSPDGRSVAVLYHRYKHGPGRPPEPPKTLERWARLKVLRDGKIVYDSGYENLNIYQMSPGFALDLVWSPDSKHLAYRHITSLRTVGPDGKAITYYDVAPNDSAISSFRWIDNERLLVVSKKTSYPLDMQGKPYCYNGYGDQAKDIRITRLHLTKGKTDRYQQTVDKPTFLFHAIDFCVDEISPKADRVAFSDGVNLCVYDDTAGKLVAKIEIPQKPSPIPPPAITYPPGMDKSRVPRTEKGRPLKPAHLEGVWWQTNNTILIGVGLLGCPDDKKAFFTFDIASKALTNRSNVLLPVWLRRLKAPPNHDPYWLYRDPDWFRSAMK